MKSLARWNASIFTLLVLFCTDAASQPSESMSGLAAATRSQLRELRLEKSKLAIGSAPSLGERTQSRVLELGSLEVNQAVLRDLSLPVPQANAEARVKLLELSRLAGDSAGERYFGSSGYGSQQLQALAESSPSPVSDLKAVLRRLGVDQFGRLLLRDQVLIVNREDNFPITAKPGVVPPGFHVPLGFGSPDYDGKSPVWRNGLLYAAAIGTMDSLEAGRVHCSGTIVGASAVLTAAHCLIDIENEKPLPMETMRVFLPWQGGSTSARTPSGVLETKLKTMKVTALKWIGSTSISDLPSSKADVNAAIVRGEDLALIFVNPSDMKLLIAKIPQVKISPQPAAGLVSMVGFGLYGPENGAPQDGTNLAVGVRQDSPIAFDGGDLLLYSSPGSTAGGFCGGDSGGGLFRGRVTGGPTSSLDLIAVISALLGSGDSSVAGVCKATRQAYMPLTSQKGRSFVCKYAPEACS